MMICVTNRKLCRGDFLERIEQLAAGGADAILLREKDLSVPEYAALAKQCLTICQAHHTPLWLNSFREVAGALQLPVQLPMPILRTLTESHRAQLPAIGTAYRAISPSLRYARPVALIMSGLLGHVTDDGEAETTVGLCGRCRPASGQPPATGGEPFFVWPGSLRLR